MENTNYSPENLEPTNGNENNNLQNNSEENTSVENTKKPKPIRVPGMIDKMLEEGERIAAEREKQKANLPPAPTPIKDPSIWDYVSKDDEEKEEENNNQDKTADSKKKARVNKDSSTKLARLRRTKSQKEKKYDRLVREMKSLKADLKRGYRIDENGDGQKVHTPIDSTDNLVISLKVSELDLQRFKLRTQIGNLDQDIKTLAAKKLSNSRIDKKEAVRSKQESDLVKRVNSELDKASRNGAKELISDIQQQVQAGKKNDAYNSLKSFLSQEVKTVSKKLAKSEELEKSVLERVLDKLSAVQS